MPDKDPTEEDLGAGAPQPSTADGETDWDARLPATAEFLSKMTLRQLQDGAKRLGLSAFSKLKKDALVRVVLEAWGARAGTNGGGQQGASAAAATATAEAAATVPAAPETTQTAPRSHKFEVGEPGRASTEESRASLRESSKEIPWGYGRDRVTAMPVDPERLFAYWEVLDDSITVARGKLGAGGPGAWLNLRVYDTTGRIFDGTNAHSFFDHRVERGDRQWFFPIGRPTSQLIIEIGMKSDEGYFVKIVRSGRVEFPRREPAPWSEPEWLTVRVSTGQAEQAGARLPGRPHRWDGDAPVVAAAMTPKAAPGLTAPTTSDPPPTTTLRRLPWGDAIRFVAGGGAERLEWEEVQGHGVVEEHRHFRWDGPMTISTWEAGPFSYPVEIPEPLREAFSGKTRVLRLGGRTHVVYGPWQVIIRGLGATRSRVILSRWEVYRTWAEQVGRQVEEFGTGSSTDGAAAGASERMVGSSERRWAGGSELRLGGASEVFFLKASELRLGGASEIQLAGASERRMMGASERLYAGASERRLGGASERRYAGASEARSGGSSGQPSRGFLGGSEQRLGSAMAAVADGREQSAASVNPTAAHAYPSPPSQDSDGDDKASMRGGT